jgi:hypothetical protein
METVTTEDGSFSIRDPATGELHHNRAGAFTEALINYIQPAGLYTCKTAYTELVVLDACWGMGYNTLTLLSEMMRGETSQFGRIVIMAVEADQAVLDMAPLALEYRVFHGLRDSTGYRRQLLDALASLKNGDGSRSIDGGLRGAKCSLNFQLPGGCEVVLSIMRGDIRCQVPTMVGCMNLDLVFHDPFSPKHVAELWTVDLFRCYRELLFQRKGRMLTYSSAGAVRGGMREAGFFVWRSTACGGKSGGTVGSIADSELDERFVFPLSADEERKVESGSGVPYRDPTLQDTCIAVRQRRVTEQLHRIQSKSTL